MARRAEVVSMKDELVAPVRLMLRMLSFATALLLFITCANLVSLFLERTESRRREMAIRTALGASRQQILRPFVIEGVVLVLVGGAIGIAVASWMVQLTVLVVTSCRGSTPIRLSRLWARPMCCRSPAPARFTLHSAVCPFRQGRTTRWSCASSADSTFGPLA